MTLPDIPDTLQSQLADIAPYYSPVAAAQARIKELEAALHKIAYEQIGPADASHRYVLDACVDIAIAALSKGEQGAT